MGQRGVYWGLCVALLSTTWIVYRPTALLLGQTAAPRERSPADEFPELLKIDLSIDRFVGTGQTLRVAGDPLPVTGRILAYESNPHFLYAMADIAPGDRFAIAARDDGAAPKLLRRVVFLKPSVFLYDEVLTDVPSDAVVHKILDCRAHPTVSGDRLQVVEVADRLDCQTLLPAGATLQQASDERDSIYQIKTKPEDGTVRFLQLFHIQDSNDDRPAAKATLENSGGQITLTIITADHVFKLALPPTADGNGRIAIDDSLGKSLLPRRPLAAGVLPHGPDAAKLIERWDRAYRDGRRPGWDTGLPAEDLIAVVENGDLKPCRTAVLGCGSGTNAIYLAQKGFDVTAVDIAPTALAIAETKAEKAGVEVKWLLADVLNLPPLEPFDLLFDRGCYHNVRYVDAEAFLGSVRRISRPGTLLFILSLKRDGPPGVRERHLRKDFAESFEFVFNRESDITTGAKAQHRRASWSTLLRRREEP